MPLILTHEELVCRAKAADLTIAEVCRRAKVAQSTPVRWKDGTHEPRMATLRRITEVIESAEAQASVEA